MKQEKTKAALSSVIADRNAPLSEVHMLSDLRNVRFGRLFLTYTDPSLTETLSSWNNPEVVSTEGADQLIAGFDGSWVMIRSIQRAKGN